MLYCHKQAKILILGILPQYLPNQAINFCCHEYASMCLMPFSQILGVVLIFMQVLIKVVTPQNPYLAICDRKVLTQEFFTSKTDDCR